MESGNGGGRGPTVVEFPKFRGLPKLPKFDGGMGMIILGLVVLVLLSTCFYTIDPEEVGVVLRFGQYARTADPGLNFKFPRGIERVIRVPVERQLKQEFGFRTNKAGVRSTYQKKGYEGESNMLTGDLNAADVEWVVQYRVVDPFRYLFRVRNVDETLRDMSEAVMREVVGDRTVNEVLTVGRAEIEGLMLSQLQTLCEQYETGIKVDQVVLQDVNPPEPVKDSFNEVNEAEQVADRLRNEAESRYNQVIPRAEGEALQVIQAAEGYALDRVNRSEGEAARFDALYEEYRKAPEVTRRRIYLETLGEVLPKAGGKTVVDDEVKSLVPLLNLNSGKSPAGGG